MGEPALDLSEIIELYKDDARHMIGLMQSALSRWDDLQRGGEAQREVRRLSHQLRGSGRTYGFRNVTRISKAIEGVMQKLEKKTLPANERTREVLVDWVGRLAAVFIDERKGA